MESKTISFKVIFKGILKPFPHPRSIRAIEALAIKRGSESGLQKAEAFNIIRKNLVEMIILFLSI